MAKVFISYRRDDSPDSVGRLRQKLADRFGSEEVFYDHVGIQPGEPFPEKIRLKIEAAEFVLVVIGPKWLELLRGRKHEPIDYCRQEVMLAQASGRTIIPVAVGKAGVPTAGDLADFPEMQRLCRLNVREIRPDPDFDPDSAALAEQLGRSTRPSTVETHGGQYTILDQIGEGGMGVVYVANQEGAGRRVAIKEIKPGMDTADVLARFDAERVAMARLDHPNIVKVLDAGTSPKGRPFIVMEYVEGSHPVTDYCDRYRLPVGDRLRLFQKICSAVEHAHQKAIIHRDIKPGNVLATGQKDRPEPKLVDFGLAKALTAPLTPMRHYSQYGTHLGTLEYSSPEQIEGDTLAVDTRTDVYSLGVLLYELLTGWLPFPPEELQNAGEKQARRRIQEEVPPKPSSRLSAPGHRADDADRRREAPTRLAQAIRGDLDNIVMKAIAKEPADRYRSVAALAEDVGRHLNDEPVHAGPNSSVYKLRKFYRRNRPQVVTAAAVFFFLLGCLGYVEHMRRHAEETAAAERQARKLAQQRTEQLFRYSRLLEDVFREVGVQKRRGGNRSLESALAARLAEAADRLGDETAGGPAPLA